MLGGEGEGAQCRAAAVPTPAGAGCRVPGATGACCHPLTRIDCPFSSLRIWRYAASAIAYTWGDRSPRSTPLHDRARARQSALRAPSCCLVVRACPGTSCTCHARSLPGTLWLWVLATGRAAAAAAAAHLYWSIMWGPYMWGSPWKGFTAIRMLPV